MSRSLVSDIIISMLSRETVMVFLIFLNILGYTVMIHVFELNLTSLSMTHLEGDVFRWCKKF